MLKRCKTCGKKAEMDYCSPECFSAKLKGDETCSSRLDIRESVKNVIPEMDFTDNEYVEYSERALEIYHSQRKMNMSKAQDQAIAEIVRERKITKQSRDKDYIDEYID